jgi:hypothetical protein
VAGARRDRRGGQPEPDAQGARCRSSRSSRARRVRRRPPRPS